MKEQIKSIRKAYLTLVISLGIFSGIMVLAAWYTSQVAPQLMADNYRSVQFATAMERSFMSLYLAESAGKLPDQRDKRTFQENLQAALGNITEPGEFELLKNLEKEWNSLQSNLQSPSHEEFQSILNDIQRCITINETRMFSLGEKAKNLGFTVTAFGIMGLSLALLYAVQYVDKQLKKLSEL